MGWGTEALELEVSHWDSSNPGWCQRTKSYPLEVSSHDVDLLSLGEVEDFFGSGAHHLVILANRQERLQRERETKAVNELRV